MFIKHSFLLNIFIYLFDTVTAIELFVSISRALYSEMLCLYKYFTFIY